MAGTASGGKSKNGGIDQSLTSLKLKVPLVNFAPLKSTWAPENSAY